MERYFFSFFALIMLAAWIALAVRLALSQKGLTKKSVLNLLGSACVAIGGAGFFGSAISATTGLGPFDSVEWPVGEAIGALRYPDGTVVVPHDASGRVQIYNQSLEYLRGWHVNANGGVFRLYPANDTSFYIYTARGHMKYQYDLSGTLISSDTYNGKYPEDSPQTVNVWIPTPFYLLVFAHPIASWIVGALGIFFMSKADARGKKPRKRSH